jgi:hypothetical protein
MKYKQYLPILLQSVGGEYQYKYFGGLMPATFALILTPGVQTLGLFDINNYAT